MQTDLAWDEFMRVDMRVGRIVEVEDFPEARKPAWKLHVDFGEQIGPVRSECLVLGTYAADGAVLLLSPEPQAELGDRVG